MFSFYLEESAMQLKKTCFILGSRNFSALRKTQTREFKCLVDVSQKWEKNAYDQSSVIHDWPYILNYQETDRD